MNGQDEKLRQLLALKRHEQPPPGYFDRFSSQVIGRIQAGEEGSRESFWARWTIFRLPAPVAWSFGTALVVVMAAGLFIGFREGRNPQHRPLITEQASTNVPATPMLATNEPSIFDRLNLPTEPASFQKVR